MKTILITGASSGIGRALAVQAGRAGYAVYAVARNVRALAALAGQIGEEGGTVVIDATDISDPANAPGLIGRAVGAFGHVDILVNNAGAAASGPLAMQSDEQLRAQFGTHVIGPVALTREALPTLRASRGHVFMIGSGVARVPIGGMGAYPPSKAALRSATAILRRELIPLDIAVTYVDPGAVDTGFMTRAGMPGAPRDVLVSPELVARKVLLAIITRPNVLNVAPLQAAAVAIAEAFPGIAEAVMRRNPNLVGAGPSLAAIEVGRDNNGRSQKIALPSARPLPPAPDVASEPEPEPEPAAIVEAIEQDEVLPPLDGTLDAPVIEMPVIEAAPLEPATVEPPPYVQPPARWQYEPPETPAGDVALDEPAAAQAVAETPARALDGAEAGATGDEDADALDEASPEHNVEPLTTGSSFDAAIEPLLRRMERAKLSVDFVRSLMIVDAVIDIGDAAMRWAGMPNKHERALTSEVFFALAEWGFLAPRADGRYRVLYPADGEPAP